MTAPPANLCDLSTPTSCSGTPLERGSDTATEGKGRLRRFISNAKEQDGWWRLQWKQHVFTSQRISNSSFQHVQQICLVAMVQSLPEAGVDTQDRGNNCLIPVLMFWIFWLGLFLSFGYWSYLLQSQLRQLIFFFLILFLQSALSCHNFGNRH